MKHVVCLQEQRKQPRSLLCLIAQIYRAADWSREGIMFNSCGALRIQFFHVHDKLVSVIFLQLINQIFYNCVDCIPAVLQVLPV